MVHSEQVTLSKAKAKTALAHFIDFSGHAQAEIRKLIQEKRRLEVVMLEMYNTCECGACERVKAELSPSEKGINDV